VTTLLKIAGALGVSIGHFLGTELPDPPKAVRSRALQAEPSAPGSTSLSGPRGRFRSTGAVSRLAPGDARRGRRAPGEALVVVVHGSLAVRVRAQEHTLVAGESLHFPTDVEHRWSNPGPGLAQAVWFTVAD
jgi:quercetin dioxygenase-like cupin family protein